MGIFSMLRTWMKAPKRTVARVRAKDAETLRKEGAVVLDVREGLERKRGHIPGSIHIPLGEIESRMAEIPKDRPVVVHCWHGGRSTAACSILSEKGYDVKDLAGGIAAWEDAGMPTEKGKKG